MKHAVLRLIALTLLFSMLSAPALAYTKLQRGSSGQEVMQMQLALRSLGYSITPDGKYGAATVAVVKSFQSQYGLKMDGVAGNQTLSLLYALASAYAPEETALPTQAPLNPYTPVYQGGITAIVVTTGGSLNLRSGPSSAARVITTIPNGASLTVVQQGPTWTSVYYAGLAGYVMTEFLSFTGSAPAAPTQLPTLASTAAPTLAPTQAPSAGSTQAMVVTTGGGLNLRETASATARILATIPNGAWITVTARGSYWSAVYYNGYTGFVMSQFLSFGAFLPTSLPAPTQSVYWPTYAPTAYIPTTAPTQAPSSAYGETAYVTTTGGSLNLRESPQSNARVLTTIPNGAALTILSRGSVWCATVYNGIPGYVMTSFLRFAASPLPTQAPTVAPTLPPSYVGASIAYVTTTGGSLNLRENPQSNARILLTIPNNTQLTVTERGAVWCKTKYLGVEGYVMTSFLAFSGSAAPTYAPVATQTPVVSLPTQAPTAAPSGTAIGTALVTTSGGTLNLRADASTASRVLTAVPNAAALTVYSRDDTWCAVSYNGIRGYVQTQYLTFIGGAAPSQDTDAEDDDPSVYTRTLKKGMTGEDVNWVQNRLLELGYTLTLTNIYDDATFAAIKAFQTQNGLTADGLAGSQTFAMLKSGNARKAGETPLNYSALRIDDTGTGVSQVQTDLKALGYPVTVNGTFDVNTHNAVVAFQQRNGLVISGIADALTRQILHGGSGKPYSTPVTELPANEGWMATPAASQLKLLHWQNDIKPSVRVGQAFTVFDPNTNLSWKLVFYSLGRHADSQPASWKDTQIMNRSFGSTSWTIHPVYVQLPSGQWTMATMHNRPHLYGSITDNGFGGHLCVHFLRDMAEAQANDPNYGVNNQVMLRNAWKALTGETVN